MNDSILDTIKRLLGNEYDDFNFDLIIHINSAFTVLRQILPTGIRINAEGFRITGSTETWNQFVADERYLDEIKTYVYLKVRKVFDPPQNSSHLTALDEALKEYEWRLSVEKID